MTTKQNAPIDDNYETYLEQLIRDQMKKNGQSNSDYSAGSTFSNPYASAGLQVSGEAAKALGAYDDEVEAKAAEQKNDRRLARSNSEARMNDVGANALQSRQNVATAKSNRLADAEKRLSFMALLRKNQSLSK